MPQSVMDDKQAAAAVVALFDASIAAHERARASTLAAVIEAARVLSKQKFPGTIVYAALMGEEQGLYGGKTLANYAKAQGWNYGKPLSIADTRRMLAARGLLHTGTTDPDLPDLTTRRQVG